MLSVPSAKLARMAAVESGRPWRVEDLRAKALGAYRSAASRAASLGLPDKQASALVRGSVYEEVLQAGKGMRALPPDQAKPTLEQIETALHAFTTEQWIILIDGFDQTATTALLSYMRREPDELKHRLGARKAERIEGRAIMRDTDLWLRENRSKVVPISDVYWSLLWPDLARQANREGKGHPATGRSVAELSSNRSIARHLSKRDEQTGREMKVSRYEIRRWRAWAERLPFEQYAADVGADDDEKRAAAFIDWLTMIRKKYQRKN
jgi:hypothetical protein